jgi:hypothetical protein
MQLNWIYIFAAGLIPLITGFIWYHNSVFGKAWMRASGMTEEKMKGGNMALIFALTYVFGVMIAIVTTMLTIHQLHYYSLFANDPALRDSGSELSRSIQQFMDVNGQNFRTFKHGAFHGVLSGIFFAFPLVGIVALFERRNWKYILIHGGYWALTLGLMGGVICAFA